MRRSFLLAAILTASLLAAASWPARLQLQAVAAGRELDATWGDPPARPATCSAPAPWQGVFEAPGLELRLTLDRLPQTGDLTPIADCDN